jgi:hypothetical protein
MMTAEEARHVYLYDPETGNLTYKNPKSNAVKAGRRAGTVGTDGYIKLTIYNRRIAAGRLIWLYMTGEWPTHHIDHVNGCPADNRWLNLRQATVSQNMCNTRTRKNTLSGVKGVTWCKDTRRWRVVITHQKKSTTIGRFDTLQEAAEARRVAAMRLHGAFAKSSEAPA